MVVPVLTIPETAFESAAYSIKARQKSQLVQYLIRLTNGSALFLTLAYFVGAFGLKPLLEIKSQRRLEVLEKFRARLRDFYLNLIGRVSYIPIVAINKNDGSGKLYADAVVQTTNSYLKEENGIPEVNEEDAQDSLSQNKLLFKLNQLSENLGKCTSYQVSEMPHYKTLKYSIEDFQSKADMVYFNENELFTTNTEGSAGSRKKNLVLETKNKIRSIKGSFISGIV